MTKYFFSLILQIFLLSHLINYNSYNIHTTIQRSFIIIAMHKLGYILIGCLCFYLPSPETLFSCIDIAVLWISLFPSIIVVCWLEQPLRYSVDFPEKCKCVMLSSILRQQYWFIGVHLTQFVWSTNPSVWETCLKTVIFWYSFPWH